MKKKDQGVNRENLGFFLSEFVRANALKVRDVARSMGCSQKTLERIMKTETYPTERLIKQCGIMLFVGFDEYEKLSKSQKEKITEGIGAIGGGTLGFGVIGGAISASGSVVGLSAAGITSGLAGLGVAGTGMVGGVMVAAAIPVSGLVAGYALVKAVKKGVGEYKLSREEIDQDWEEEI